MSLNPFDTPLPGTDTGSQRPPYAIVQGQVLSDRQASAVAHSWSNPLDGLAAGCVASAGRWCGGERRMSGRTGVWVRFKVEFIIGLPDLS